MRKVLAAALVCGSLALAGPQLAGAQTMTGAVLNGTANPTLGIGAVDVDCQLAGTSTVTYDVEGAALGPFVGTFEESGTFTIAGGQVTSFNATFTITAGTTQVTGTKTLRQSSTAVCTPNPEPGVLQFTDILIEANYSATISTPSGTTTDSGRATTTAQMIEGLLSGSGSMQESFVSEGLANTPGNAVGAGAIDDGTHDWVVFAFTAKSNGTSPQAKCTVVADGILIKCLDATLLNQTDTHVTIVGNALVNGVPTTYRIDADDLGHPVFGDDAFEIQTGTGFHAEGEVEAGIVKIFD
jgi:hypothetical protein